MDVALRIAYDGTLFRGLARQPSGKTVEDALLAALAHEGYVDGSLRAGSRTDAGVSAAENVLKVRLDRPHLKGLLPALQTHLPPGIWITGAAQVDATWNVQHARSRTYTYLAPQHDETLALMEGACAAFLGEHDFSAFARMEDRKATRPVDAFTVEAAGGFWRFRVTAPGFLWNQVRRMVDACLAVGQGRAAIHDIEGALAGGPVHGEFRLAAPEGLCLQAVAYEPAIQWAAEAGDLPRGRLLRPLQSAQVRRELLERLSESS